MPGGRRASLASVQPTLHLRRRRTRQDAPPARRRAPERASLPGDVRRVSLLRAVHERAHQRDPLRPDRDRKSTRLNSSHGYISYAVFCLKKKKKTKRCTILTRTI